MNEKHQDDTPLLQTDEKTSALPGSSENLNFKDVGSLAKASYVPEPWYSRVGWAFLEGCVSVGVFLLGFLLDILKTLWQVLKGLFLGFYKIGKAIGRFFRKAYRIFREGDASVKGSFALWGFGNIKTGQIVQGLIFFACEIIFVWFLAARGINDLVNLVMIGEGAAGHELDNNTSVKYLIAGILALIFIIAGLYVWISAVKSAYDCYIIKNNFRFLQAKEDQLQVLDHYLEYTSIYKKKTVVGKDGKETTLLKFVSKKRINEAMRFEYGYSALSARYISYLPFARVVRSVDYRSDFQKWSDRQKGKFYQLCYKAKAKIRKGRFSDAFVSFLEWEPAKRKPFYGLSTVRKEVVFSISQFHHTFDKYNDYLVRTRDMKSLLEVLKNPSGIESSIYAKDAVSVKNKLTPIPENQEINPKEAASRILAFFGCSYADAVVAARTYLKAKKDQARSGISPIDAIQRREAALRKELDAFEQANSHDLLEGVHFGENVYADYETYRELYNHGPKAFAEKLKVQHIGKASALRFYEDYRDSIKEGHNQKEAVIANLEKRAVHYHDLETLYETYPFHGQPILFAKKAKQFRDEKFAVTILSIPTLMCIITVVLPLLFSIVIAFTNWNYPNTAYGNFDWGLSSVAKMFSISGSDNYAGTFLYVFQWTLVWAFFATFSNYLLGIILALLINKKGIKLKKMWRAFFVITIAIPQFVTLLGMSRILGAGGPINTWFFDMGWVKSLDTFWLNDPSNFGIKPKIALILVNCWVGVPYTMLSTSGILMNIPEDLYESARIDGASPTRQFFSITMPYILFVTGPSLLTAFIGNINNFNVIYFLTGGGPSTDGSITLANNAQLTDLLITWLYKMTVNAARPTYAIGSTIGILIFVICAFFSLIMYKRLGSTKNEEEFQ